MDSEIYTEKWLDKQFSPLVRAARKRGVDPLNVQRFAEFLQRSRDSRINWGASTVRHFAGYAGAEYQGLVEGIT